MGQLIYSSIASLDGYTADRDGRFDWAAPSEAVHAYVNELERPIGTYLYGRRMYETMRVWETDADFAAGSPITADYARIWQAAEKVVYSTTLATVETERTRIERTFDPDAVRAIVTAAAADVSIGGPHLAAAALTAGLVDEVQLLLVPVVVGGGTPFSPPGLRRDFTLVGTERVDDVVHLRYRLVH
ncbi:deaminase [Tersicoccus solisilvae]|uniref:Deaminase n=1 Tax=Tersicoccus solisilvae TaxID=1882339 RepID=A0ABQ1NLS8_9MICC|nr:dihydrofolate reductase family protein [Tersicoccus solisilvae]GGC78357.1 deaminase [Tersicoccus solisilvae]